MRNIKTYISTLLLTLALGSCQNDEIATSFASDPLAVNIHAMVGDNNILSRSNPVGNEAVQTTFNSGDQIAISNGGEYVTYQLDAAGKWQPQAGKYLKWEQEAMTFDAYYPVIEGSSISSFTLPADQSTLSAIAAADYMKVEGVSASRADGDLSLSFVRQMARVTIMIASFGDEYTNDEKTVSGVKLHSAETEIAPYNTGGNGANASFTAIVIPSDIAVGNTLMSFVDGKGNTQVVKAPSIMEPGKSYTYTLHVGKDAATIASVTVEDWTTGETVDGETELAPPAISDFYYSDGTCSSKLESGKTCIGIVYWTNPTSPKHIKIVSLDETMTTWSTSEFEVGTGEYAAICDAYPGNVESIARKSGAVNRAILNAFIEANIGTYSIDDFPAFKVAEIKGEGWSLPALNELQYLYCASKGATPTTWLYGYLSELIEDSAAAAKFNDALKTVGTPLNKQGCYCSATEYSKLSTWAVVFTVGYTYQNNKLYDRYLVRLVRDIVMP